MLLFGNHTLGVLIEPLSFWELNTVLTSKTKLALIRGATFLLAVSVAEGLHIILFEASGVFCVTIAIVHQVVGSCVWDCRDLFCPNFVNVICNVWRGCTSWSVNWEFLIETLSSFSSLETLLIFKSNIQAWCFPCATVGFAIIEAESTLNLLSHGNLLSNGVDLISQVLLSANTSRIDIITKAVTLHRGVQLRRSWPRIEVHSLLICLLGVLECVVGLVERHTVLELFVPLLHLIGVELDGVTSIHNGPIHAHMFR